MAKSNKKLNIKFGGTAMVALTLAIILLLSVTVTVAWFINYQINQLGGSTITVSGSRVLKFAIIDENDVDNHAYVSQATRNFGEYGLSHVTGNGVEFWIPALQQGDVATTPDQNGEWETAVATDGTAPGDYVHLCIKFFSEDPMDVYLGRESSVLPATEANPSNYGDFSRNNIASASRISFLNTTFDQEGNKTEQFNFVWIPNALGQLIDNNGRYSFVENGVAESSYSYYYVNSSDEKIATTWSQSQYVTQPTAQASQSPQDGTGWVTTLQQGENGEYSAYVSINVWVEGCDRECRRALAGGRFDVYLQFIGITI